MTHSDFSGSPSCFNQTAVESWRIRAADPARSRAAKFTLFRHTSSSVRSPAIASGKTLSDIRFRAKLRDQAFHGATDLLHVETDGGLILTVRTASRDLPNSKAPLEFEFSAADAIPVRRSDNNNKERR